MTRYLFRFWVPLSNFHTDRQPIQLREDLEITKASAFENELLLQLKAKWTNLRFSDLLLRLSLKKEQPEAEPDIYLPDARKEIEKAITIFRLFKAQVTGFNLIIQQYSGDASYAYSANALLHYMLWATPDSTLARETFILREHEIDTFISFFRTYDTPTMSKIATRF